MYNIAKNTIKNGRFELSDILKKIDKKWFEGGLTDEERIELIQLAQEKADARNGVDSFVKLAEHDRRLKALEDAVKVLQESKVEEPETPTEETYPEFVVGKWYYTEDRITFDGKVYECIAPYGQVCTWNPVEYPAYWQIVESVE